jgi:surface antigen
VSIYQESPAGTGQFKQPEISTTSYPGDVLSMSKRLIGRAAIALGLAVGAVIAEPAAASADTGGYPDWNATDCSATYGTYSWCKPGDDWISPRGYGYNNCTDWAAFRIPQLTGKPVPNNLGHAQYWNDNAPSAWTIDSTAEPGDIAVWEDGEFGHVAVVESINPLVVSEYNRAGTGIYGTRTNPAGIDHFLDLNGTGVGVGGGGTPQAPPPPPIAPVIDSLVTPDGVQHVYSGTSTGKIYETWWGPNSPTPTTWLVMNVGSDVNGISGQITPDGVQHVYYGTQTGTVGELWWGPNSNGVRAGQAAQLGAPVTSLSGQVTPDGIQHMYSATADGRLFETWWGANPAVTTQIYNTGRGITALSSQVTPDTFQHLFFGAADGTVGEVWWGPGSNGGHLGYTSNVGTNVTSISSQITGDGVRHIYSADAYGDIEETWWGYGSSGPTTWRIGNVGQHPTSVTSQVTPDNTQHVYYGTSFGQSGELWWGPNSNGVRGAQVYNDPASVSVSSVSSEITSNSTQNLYVANNSGTLFARWWGYSGSGVSVIGNVS